MKWKKVSLGGDSISFAESIDQYFCFVLPGAQDGVHEHRTLPHVPVRPPVPVRYPSVPVCPPERIGRVALFEYARLETQPAV